MGFKKGNPGKPKGAKSVKTTQWEALVETLEGDQAENFRKFMGSLWNGTKEDKTSAANLYLRILEFHKPKIQRSVIEGGGENKEIVITHRILNSRDDLKNAGS